MTMPAGMVVAVLFLLVLAWFGDGHVHYSHRYRGSSRPHWLTNDTHNYEHREMRPFQQLCPVHQVCKSLHMHAQSEQTVVHKTDRPRQIVDIFYLFLASDQEYIRKGYFWVLPSVALAYSRTSSNGNEQDTRIHIVTDSPLILSQAESLGYHAYDIHPYFIVHHRLLSLIQNTVTSMEYKVTIFRWTVYNSIVENWNIDHPHSPITRVLVLDGDVLMTMNAAEFYDSVVGAIALNSTDPASFKQPEYINMAYGVVGLFTVGGLRNFTSYIDTWYSGTAEDIKHRCALAGGKFWSDMILLESFVSAVGSTIAERNNCFEFSRYEGYDQGWRKETGNQCLLEALGCIPLTMYHSASAHVAPGPRIVYNGTVLNGLRHPNPQQLHMELLEVHGGEETLPYCFIHFQGVERKAPMYLFGRALEILHNDPATVDRGSAYGDLRGGLLLQALGSRQIYHVATDNRITAINSMDEFIASNFSIGDIVAHAPPLVIAAFSPAKFVPPWKAGDLVGFVNDRSIYQVDNPLLLRPFPSADVFIRHGHAWSDVKRYPAFSAEAYPGVQFGPNMQR